MKVPGTQPSTPRLQPSTPRLQPSTPRLQPSTPRLPSSTHSIDAHQNTKGFETASTLMPGGLFFPSTHHLSHGYCPFESSWLFKNGILMSWLMKQSPYNWVVVSSPKNTRNNQGSPFFHGSLWWQKRCAKFGNHGTKISIQLVSLPMKPLNFEVRWVTIPLITNTY